MNNKTVIGIIIVLLLIGAGYLWSKSTASPVPVNGTNAVPSATTSPLTTGETSGPPGSISNMPVEPAAAAARADLAASLGVPKERIVIMRVEERTWNDGCLGLGGKDELCTQALIDGFRVEMEVNGKGYVYRTNESGSNLRRES